jgi:peroxiredoxin
MGLRADLVVLAAIVAGSAYAVVWQSRPPEAPADAVAALGIGEEAEDFVLTDVGGETRNLAAWTKGKQATVLYFWSTTCPCVATYEKRLKPLMKEFGPKGVEFVAIDGHPDDTKDLVLQAMVDLRAEYRMLLDPTQKVVRRFGVTKATEAVVLDARKRVRYRGGIDDSIAKPTKPYLRDALVAVLEGRSPDPATAETEGCPFPGLEGVCASE